MNHFVEYRGKYENFIVEYIVNTSNKLSITLDTNNDHKFPILTKLDINFMKKFVFEFDNKCFESQEHDILNIKKIEPYLMFPITKKKK